MMTYFQLWIWQLMLSILLIIVRCKIPMPWQYHGYDDFPVFFFGASPKDLESISTMTLAARHNIAGWGWQQNNTGINGSEEQNLYNQAKAFYNFYNNKSNNIIHNTYSTFVYRTGSSANPFWKTMAPIVFDPNYKHFWIQNNDHQVCWLPKTGLYDHLEGGPMFNFSNSSAANYYLEYVIKELVNNIPYINSVFFDLCDWAYCAYPWDTTNCTQWEGPTNDEKRSMGMAAVNVFKKAAEILNNNGIIPVYSFMTLLNENGLMDKYTECEVDEETWIYALENVTWFRYQEYWPDVKTSKIDDNSASVMNMIGELKYELPIQIHAYGIAPNQTIDPYFVGSFLLGQQNYSYFSCSNGWFDANWSWHKTYDNVYGKPLDAPIETNDGKWFRSFDKGNLTVDIVGRTADFVWK
eukprot:268380_1